MVMNRNASSFAPTLGRLDEAMAHLDKTSQVDATFAFNCVQSDG